MKLNDFLETASSPQFFNPYRIINLIIPAQESILFSRLFVSRLKTLLEQEIVWCNLQTQSSSEIQLQLSTSFLGTAYTYVINSTSEHASKDVAVWNYLESYDGVHHIVLITTHENALRERAEVLHIFCDEKVDAQGYYLLQKFLLSEIHERQFVHELFQRVRLLPLETACLMMHYHLCLGKNMQQFFTQWFDRIVEEKPSLFQVSQYLFARDQQRFYQLWRHIGSEYPPEFWVSFWSEQLWQAMIFISIAQQHDLIHAKKAVTRLPFSFMQKDWHKHSVAALTDAHDMLCQIDYTHKNGALTDGLTVWYGKLFN